MRSLILLVIVGCGAGAKERAQREAIDFVCRDRYAAYAATHHMGGDEVGVQMDCAEKGPRIKRWRMDKQGKRVEDERAISPADFDVAWREIDGTGWPNLKDCGNGSDGKQDPIYTFDIKDDQNKASFQCQTQNVPYPYHDIVDPLDVVAQKNGKQLGDDEPQQLKDLDKKPGQKKK